MKKFFLTGILLLCSLLCVFAGCASAETGESGSSSTHSGSGNGFDGEIDFFE